MCFFSFLPSSFQDTDDADYFFTVEKPVKPSSTSNLRKPTLNETSSKHVPPLDHSRNRQFFSKLARKVAERALKKDSDKDELCTASLM